jgi:acyl carrier protein
MLPAIYVPLTALPQIAGGKVDRQALKRLVRQHPVSQASRLLPRTPVERKLVEIWSELLGVPDISVDAGFFELGGHSLWVMRMLQRVQECYGLEIPIRDFLQAPTIAALAVFIAQGLAARSESDEIAQFLKDIE